MGEMIKMVIVLTVLSVVSGGSLAGLKDFTEPKIENQVMNLVKGPAIRQMLNEADNDPVADRFKIMDGDVERNVFVGVFGGTADTVVMGPPESLLQFACTALITVLFATTTFEPKPKHND